MTNFNDIYKANKNQVQNYIYSKVLNFEDAEDITILVFTKLHKYPYKPNNKQKASLNSYLRTLTNCAISDFYRRANHKLVPNTINVSGYVDDNGNESFQFEGGDEANERIEAEELKEEILKAFANLKPKYKRIAILYFMREKKYEEIATICNVPMNTVKVMIKRCREMLQVQLKPVYAK